LLRGRDAGPLFNNSQLEFLEAEQQASQSIFGKSRKVEGPMPEVQLRGITWQHRRAIDPLMSTLSLFRSQHPEIDIHWFCRPLHGFEFTPIVDLAKEYDLIVLDHPFVGDIAASSCLLPIEDLIAPDECAAFVGPSLEGYRFAGRLWAIPIDAACQVAVSRPDLMGKLDQLPPANWNELIRLGHRAAEANLSLAIGLRGVHSLMTFFSLCANLGSPCSVEPHLAFVDPGTARAALAMLRDLVALCPTQCLDWNSIELHEAMVARDDLLFCPAVYCYAIYAEADRRWPLRFHDMPGPRGYHGSTLGGTGLGISAQCRYPEAAKAYVRFAASLPAQFAFARNHGQPALCAIWDDEEINRQFGDCFRATRQTMQSSWVRPRYPGYLDFQAKAGSRIEQHLRGSIPEAGLLDDLAQLHTQAGRSDTR
jgi:multiple sugar transport system substrate-binding protein